MSAARTIALATALQPVAGVERIESAQVMTLRHLSSQGSYRVGNHFGKILCLQANLIWDFGGSTNAFNSDDIHKRAGHEKTEVLEGIGDVVGIAFLFPT